MPTRATLHPFHFKIGVEICVFYGKTEAEARTNAEAWARRFKKGGVTRVKHRRKSV